MRIAQNRKFGKIAALALAGCLLALIPALLSRVSIREKETIGARRYSHLQSLKHLFLMQRLPPNISLQWGLEIKQSFQV